MHLGSLETTQEGRTLTHLSCSPNFASITRYTHAIKFEFLIYTKLIYTVFALMKIQLQSVDSKNQPKSLQLVIRNPGL